MERLIQAFSRLIRDIQGCWCIFSHIYRHPTREEAKPPLLYFLKSEKDGLILEKKGPECVHLWVKFSIQNVVQEYLGEKASKCFLQSHFLLWFWWNVYWSVLVPWNLPFPEKFLVLCLQAGITLFAKHSILNVWQCYEYVCLDNCSVIDTVMLHSVLHQTHIQNSGIFRTLFIQVYVSVLINIWHY